MKVIHYAPDCFQVAASLDKNFYFTISNVRNNRCDYNQQLGKLAFKALMDWVEKNPQIFI